MEHPSSATSKIEPSTPELELMAADHEDVPSSATRVILSDDDQQRIQRIKSFLASREDLDVWQWTAFKFGTEWNTEKSKMTRCRLLLLLLYPLFAFACPTVAVVTLFYYYFHEWFTKTLEEIEDDGWVVDEEWYLLLPAMFILLILLLSVNILKTTANSGFYGALHHIPAVASFKLDRVPWLGDTLRVFVHCDFMFSPLLVLGYLINVLLWAACLYINTLAVWWSETPLDLVLNLVAVFFIMDISKMLVPPDAYHEVLQWFEDSSNVSRLRSTPISLGQYKCYSVMNIVLALNVLLVPLIVVINIVLAVDLLSETVCWFKANC